MLNLFLMTSLSTAYAEETPPESTWVSKVFSMQETRIALGVANEFVSDSSIAQTYETSKVFPNIALQYRFHKQFLVSAELGLVNMTGNFGKSSFQQIPSSFHGQVLLGDERVEPFAGLGLSIVHFLENYPEGTVSGTKIGLDYRAGFRIKTNLIQSSQHPSLDMGPKQMDFEIHVGQRIHKMTGGDGFDMSSLRIGLGLNTRF